MHDRINAGEFKNKLPYARRKDNPAIHEAYVREEKRLEELFKAGALKEVGLDKHPKKDIIYEKAWSYGHPCGYGEVYVYLEELAEFLEELSKP